MMLRGADNAVALGTSNPDAPGALSQIDRDNLAAMLVGEEPKSRIPTLEEWGTSSKAIADLHAAMGAVDRLDADYPRATRTYGG